MPKKAVKHEVFKCFCGGHYVKSNKARHMKSSYHRRVGDIKDKLFKMIGVKL
jgi:hypothetical protein